MNQQVEAAHYSWDEKPRPEQAGLWAYFDFHELGQTMVSGDPGKSDLPGADAGSGDGARRGPGDAWEQIANWIPLVAALVGFDPYRTGEWCQYAWTWIGVGGLARRLEQVRAWLGRLPSWE